jgi:cytochrome P450
VTPVLEPVAHELIDRFEGRGEADLIADYTKLYPFKIILRMLGLPEASEADVTRWALGMLDIQQNHEHAVRCSQEFAAFVQPILARRRTEPAGDLISKLATEEVDGDRLTDE